MKECGWQEKRVDIGGRGCKCEVQADLVVSEIRYVKIWGRVVNCFGEVVRNALLKLVKLVYDGQGQYVYEKIAHTITDYNGYYEFELCIEDCQTAYQVLVEKSLIHMGNCVHGNRAVSQDRYRCGERNPCDCGNIERYEREYEAYDIDFGQMQCKEEKPCNPCVSNPSHTAYSMMEQEKMCSCQPIHTTRHINGTVHAPSQFKF